jgi:hypothetical protein
MKSLALWCKSLDKRENNEDNPKAEVHVNVWKLPRNKTDGFERFIDIGLLLDNSPSIEKLFIYYPEILSRNQVDDLGARIVNSSDEKLLNTIFNENYCKKSNNSNYYEIYDQLENNLFSIYKIPEGNISVDNFLGGSKISISFGGKVPNKIYIRIRIDHNYSSVFSHIDKPSNAIFQSAFSKTEIIDFRMNEARELSNELLEQTENDGKRFYFSKVNYFFVCSSREEYVFSHVPFVSSRQLEKNRWKDYIGDRSIKEEAILAYQWKEESTTGMNDFGALVKTSYENNSTRTIAKYLLILFVISILFNIISALIYNGLYPEDSKGDLKADTERIAK